MARKKPIRFFDFVEEPDIQHEIDGVKIYIFFVDNYEFKDAALRRQLFHMEAQKGSISLLLEEGIYRKIPGYYSAESLLQVHKYFMRLHERSVWPAFVLGVFVSVVFGIIAWLFSIDIFNAGLIGGAVGTTMMIGMLLFLMRRHQNMAREEMRFQLEQVHGEAQLKTYLELQDAYMVERQAKLDSQAE
jgi:hypothetical protein